MRILLPFWRGVPERCFYQDFHGGIGEALRELGHEAVAFSFAEIGRVAPAEANALFELLLAGKYAAVFDIACWGSVLSRLTVPLPGGGRGPIFDAFGIAYVGLLFDHPYNQTINVALGSRLYAAYPDRGHPEQARLAYPGLRLTGELFSPPAIRAENDRSAASWASGRDVDVLYIGNLLPEFLERIWNDRINRRWAAGFDPRFCDALADAVLAAPERALHLNVQTAIASLGGLPAGFDFYSHLRVVELFLRHRFRYDAVAAIARTGTRMLVVGKEWSRVPLPTNVQFGRETDYEGLFRLAARARICLDASTYLDGANDRVFSYTLNRAVCFTNAAGYLRGAFDLEAGMRFYSMQNLAALGEDVRSLLARPTVLQEAGDRARDAVLAGHTWHHRIAALLEAVR